VKQFLRATSDHCQVPRKLRTFYFPTVGRTEGPSAPWTKPGHSTPLFVCEGIKGLSILWCSFPFRYCLGIAGQIHHLGKSPSCHLLEGSLWNMNTPQGSSTGKTTLRTKAVTNDLTCRVDFTKNKQ